MDLKLFIKTAPWLPLFMLAGYAIPQFLLETNSFYGFIGMFGGLVLWIIFLMIAYVKSED
ncbi:MAG TPA: hypothetical protein ENH92_04645 [Ectothiorhodospiraceae bacterium]|nr:hypothetical protein [Ectothiorhodospiraceae bacterium]